MIAKIQKRIPMVAMQTALYALLTQGQTTPVYDDVPDEAKLPYITLGAFTCKQNGDKTASIWDVSIQIHGWSEYSGKAEINEILDDVSTVISSVNVDLSAANFCVIDQDIDFVEAFPEEIAGYHGVITVIAKIQDVKNNVSKLDTK
ncbi:Protein of unknown function [Propionispira arboris]|uniref:DUF3168 domain-containing protein n=1 Tax=Propionispira arboris TaxID=84035 RepID=A0A1H7AED9_9FIRM|nr:DUF3168 domain-containing protein [Propionispira arboris]SEJ60270.1 Protein of unknown function [Propionispira arboris]